MTHARTNSQKSTGSTSHPDSVPSKSVFEESEDEDESSYTFDRGTSRKFRKGGLSLITRASAKQTSSASKAPLVPGHSPANSMPGLSDGSESSKPSSVGEQTPTDDPATKRFGRAFSSKTAPSKPDHPDDELIVLMQALNKPKRRESSARTRSSHERVGPESKSLSLLFPSTTAAKNPSYTPMLAGIMIQ
ncbi:hypothetical protein Micbo1qcDRAFT_168615 [Microdochium bolleyi]|uniref:Uncharacterized protein n=1 Tax=Microdochium bolleyi TaxID=196109 RepID=A0A136IMU9_9PEZI|nr:hypothetical protein Micbo1qcDRAFT_168615 [Microdochium bolleyi]